MQQRPVDTGHALRFESEALSELFLRLAEAGYETVGPTVREGVIAYDVVSGVDDLPRGRRDVQDAGHYRLEGRDDGAFFGFSAAPQSWKRQLFPPRVSRFEAEETDQGLVFRAPAPPQRRTAFLGMRACELAAIRIQDRVFLEQSYTDPDYGNRRSGCLFVAINCTEAGGTCFCADMDAGPADRRICALVSARSPQRCRAGHRRRPRGGPAGVHGSDP